jgi:hypothetical protein
MYKKKLYKKKFKYFIKYPKINNIINTFIIVLFVNWIFQGMRGMQYKELSFRVIIEILFIFLIFYFLKFSLLLSFLLVHTFFWIFLCQFWLINRYSLNYTNNLKKMNQTYKKIINKVIRFKTLDEAIVIGSLSSQKKILKINSDVDLRIFFSNSIKSYFTLNLFLSYLRIYSFITKFPLDIYCYDNFDVFNTAISKHDKILIIKDKKKNIKNYLNKR